MRLLVLGGTAWLSGLVAADAVTRGHDVTCLARGSAGRAPDGVRLVVADRDVPGCYDAVSGEWDAVLDVTRHPGHARQAAAGLGERAAYLAFVSSCSVYAAHDQPGADETAALLPALVGERMTSMDDYGPAKVACEEAVLTGWADRCLVARPGLIGGPGDWSSRTGYWPWRFGHPATADGAVVVPDSPQLQTQVVDVRDLAAWLLDCCEHRTAGVFDAVGHLVALPEHLAAARERAGHEGELLYADQEWLAGQGVQPWMGPRSMPLWLPMPDYAGFCARSGAAARAVGLQPRPLADTLDAALDWEQQRESASPRPAGLTDEESVELVAAWRRDHRCGGPRR